MTVKHLDTNELLAGFEHIKASPRDAGTVGMLVRRPATDQREELNSGQLGTETGLAGDNWFSKGCRGTSDGAAHPDMQLNIMNVRAIQLIAGSRERWSLAGDQFYVDLDLSEENLPPGTRLRIGTAEIEITAEPHLGCSKFTARFGRDAMLFVNSQEGKKTRLRGVNAKVISAGEVGLGDTIERQ